MHISKEEAIETIASIKKDLKSNKKEEFRNHFSVYLIIISFLWTLNLYLYYFKDTNTIWAIYPTLGWGIGILLHYIKTK